jgi:hypothetical protein
MNEDKTAKQKSERVKKEDKKAVGIHTHFAITPELRIVLLNYLNHQPRKEVNNMCVLLEQAQGISLS